MSKNKSDRRTILIFLISLWVLFFSLQLISVQGKTIPAGSDKQDEAKKAEGLSLIKKELMPLLDPALAIARRDIFKPSLAAVQSGGMPQFPAQAATEAFEDAGGLDELEAGSLLESLNLSCPGIINSKQKRLALILVDGQALALAEGEELIAGIVLAKITEEEIILQDGQGNSRKIRIKENFHE